MKKKKLFLFFLYFFPDSDILIFCWLIIFVRKGGGGGWIILDFPSNYWLNSSTCLFVLLFSCGIYTAWTGKVWTQYQPCKNKNDCKNKAKSPNRPPSFSPTPIPTGFWARNAVVLPKGRCSSTRRFIMSKRSHFYLIAAWRLEWRSRLGSPAPFSTAQIEPLKKIPLSWSVPRNSPPPLPLPTSPPHGAHSGMNVSSVRRQQKWGGWASGGDKCGAFIKVSCLI